MRAPVRFGGLVVPLLAAALLAACVGERSPGAGAAPQDALTIPVGEPIAVTTDTPVYAVGRTIHVGQRTFRTRGPVTSFRVGPRGIYYRAGGSLVFTDGARSEPVARLRTDTALAPDRTALGWIDVDSSPVEPARALAFDLETGEQLVATTVGTGEAGDDLSDAYEDGPPAVVGFDDDALYYQGICCNHWRAPLDGSEVEEVPDTDDGLLRSRYRAPGQGEPFDSIAERDLPSWVGRLVPSGTVGPARRWAVLHARGTTGPVDEVFRPVDYRTGRPVEIDLPSWAQSLRLGPWIDQDEVWAGIARPRGDAWEASVVRCHLARGTCSPVTDRFRLAGPGQLRFEGN